MGDKIYQVQVQVGETKRWAVYSTTSDLAWAYKDLEEALESPRYIHGEISEIIKRPIERR